jgi:hypothetical protein
MIYKLQKALGSGRGDFFLNQPKISWPWESATFGDPEDIKKYWPTLVIYLLPAVQAGIAPLATKVHSRLSGSQSLLCNLHRAPWTGTRPLQFVENISFFNLPHGHLFGFSFEGTKKHSIKLILPSASAATSSLRVAIVSHRTDSFISFAYSSRFLHLY